MLSEHPVTMNLSGHTKPYAVLGHPIGHTLSPVMHNSAFQALGMDAVFLAFNVDPARLMNTLPVMADMGFGGVNLTIPLKEVAFKSLTNLDRSALMLGAVNTIDFRSNGMTGHNTDGRGFLIALEQAFGTNVAGLSVFVLGSGGAGRAVAMTCAAEQAARVAVTGKGNERAQQVSAEISQIVSGAVVETVPANRQAWEEACRTADLIVQATPVGMGRRDDSLLGPSAFHDGQIVIDLIYMYPETAFMKAAREGGAKTANGLGMLLHQGACAFTIWTEQEPPLDVMRKALEQEVYR